MLKKNIYTCLLSIFLIFPVLALDDLPIYYDAWEEDGSSCERTGVAAEWDLGMSGVEVTTVTVNSVQFLPINC